MMYWLTQLDDYAGWLAAVVAGLVALGWLGRRARRLFHRTAELARKIDKLDELAAYELQPNGGHSIKDRIALVPQLEARLRTLEESYTRHLEQCASTPTVVVNAPGTEKT